jgi:HlyD family secretion protein
MKPLLIVTVLVLALAGYFAYQRYGASEEGVQLATALVNRGDVVQSIDATGRLESVTTVQVGSQVSGTIRDLYADFNSKVRRGQVIARLEPSLFETQVEQAQATVTRLQADVERAMVQLEDAQIKLTRARDLATRELIPRSDLETAEASARTAEANLTATPSSPRPSMVSSYLETSMSARRWRRVCRRPRSSRSQTTCPACR